MFKKIEPFSKFHTKFTKRSFQKAAHFGICFDVDGVIGTGPTLIPNAKDAIKKLIDTQNNWKVPVAFLTNSSRLSKHRTEYLSNLLNVKVEPWQVIQSPTPLEVFTNYSDKFFLAVEQFEARDLAYENGFKNICTIEELSEAYPLLDMVNSKRKVEIFASSGDFPKIEGVVIMGEPIKWERALQLLVDVLRTQGKPTHLPKDPNLQQLPLIVCNFDLEYKSRASIPRFGNGSFLTCLEAVYEMVSGKKLIYDVIMGKPSEITMRYTEYVLEKYGRLFHGQENNIHTMYMVGDAHKIDIVASNRYQRYIDRLQKCKQNGAKDEKEAILKVNETLPRYRRIPAHPYFLEHAQNVRRMEALLVRTGLYGDGDDLGVGEKADGSHFLHYDRQLEVPQGIFDDVNCAVDHILKSEGFTECL